MDRSHTLKLIEVTYTPDEMGVLRASETYKTVYCDVKSVTGSEWYEGGRNGLNPEFRFTMFAPEYNGQTVCEYKNKRYTIYRTYYARNDMIDLYAERRQGNADNN